MQYLLQCNGCGATCWCQGREEADVNALIVEPEEWDYLPPSTTPKDKVAADSCPHEDFEVLDTDPEDPWDNYN